MSVINKNDLLDKNMVVLSFVDKDGISHEPGEFISEMNENCIKINLTEMRLMRENEDKSCRLYTNGLYFVVINNIGSKKLRTYQIDYNKSYKDMFFRIEINQSLKDFKINSIDIHIDSNKLSNIDDVDNFRRALDIAVKSKKIIKRLLKDNGAEFR